MPLVRFQVRNEYSLGQPQLYSEANREDPKAVLDGVAVAGLVGILRQLGDLAEFAAEVFHGLQEQVTTTASRSHKLMVRVQHIEAALPPLEKAVLAQTSHIHFAYTSGVEWHPRIRNEKNHFISNDLPRFIMDSYEECRDPPRFHLLDKFDTGGPGSCLKRFSDPTFFKKASAIPDEANAEKSHRSRKAQRSKKKRGAQRNRDVSRGASVSNRSGRIQYIPPIVNGASSSSQTASTAEMAIKSDRGDNSISFDSRTESGYIEYAAHPSSSMQGEERELNESPTSKLEQHDDTLDAVLPDDQTGFADDHSPGSSLQDQVTSGSSCVNWDEKAEIVDPNGEQNYIDETTGMLPTKDELDAHEGGVGNYRIVEQMDVTFDDENILQSISSRNHIDEIESEPDNFMDALNTIESESENDQDCQTKREVEQFALVNNQVAGGVHENTVDCSDHEPPTFESRTAISSIYFEEERPTDLPISASLESPMDKQMPKLATEPSNSDQTVDTNRADIFDHSRLEFVSGDSTSSSSGIANVQDKTISSLWDSQGSPADISSNDSTSSGSGTTNQQDKIVSSVCDLQESPADISRNNLVSSDPGTTTAKDMVSTSLCESQESPAEISRSNSINFWTNGGLLGLEPSKPPDFAMPSPISDDSANRSSGTVGLSSYAYELIVDEHESKLSTLGQNSGYNGKDSSSKHSMSCDQEDGISSKKALQEFSTTESYPTLGNSVHSHNAFSPSVDGGLEANVLGSGTILPVSPYSKSISNEANQENDENSFRVFGLGRRLLENGFGRKVPYTHDDKSEPARYSNLGVLEQRVVCPEFSETPFKEQFDHGFPSPPSPPLEHMKISFHPVDGIESSILKLKLSNGNQSHENVRDAFHSFQLIPEPAVPLHEFGSDSDDDTFCRSSPYISDDCLSHHSESNSEEWDESSETLESKNHELYDALCGISSVDYMSTSLGLGGISQNADYGDGRINSEHTENGPEHSFSPPLFDLPSLDALQPVLKQEAKDDSDANDLQGLTCLGDSTPGPPPLPPVQWRVSRPSFDVTEEKQDVSEGFKHVLNTELLGSISLKQSKPASAQHLQANEESITIKPRDKQEQHVNGQREADQALNGKGMDEKEDFLQQIRAKSFNLRRTATSNPTTVPVPVTNVKVTAILEKANAIRQAVGSDNGEDEDTWSDT